MVMALKSSFRLAVIGLGFGDEGKGLTTASLCHHVTNPLVVRYSGGQQAGHTVTLKDGTSHVFSNFGSGSFEGVPTYWSEFCTFDPVGVMNELKILRGKGVEPILYVNRNSPVTTPYDKRSNRDCGRTNDHGTCGVGVGATFNREENFYSLLAGDLEHGQAAMIKVGLIRDWYDDNCSLPGLTEYVRAVEEVNNSGNILIVDGLPREDLGKDPYNYICEGSQGLLLDQHYGFFPHVTRSNTGTKNIQDTVGYPTHLYLVTRAYQTRHGNGPMTNEAIDHNIIDNPLETNVQNEFQGEFRKSVLDLDLLLYGMNRDDIIRKHQSKTLVITCCDLIDGDYMFTMGNTLYSYDRREEFGEEVGKHLGISDVRLVSSSDTIIDL